MQNKIQYYRWQRNLSLNELAIKAGVGKSTIGIIENKPYSQPQIETALRLARALDVDVTKLFEI